MIFAIRIVLLLFCAFFCVAAIGSNTEQRGYLNLIGAATTGVLLLASFKIM